MAVVENGVVGAISLFDLVQRLCDQEALQSVAGHEGQRGLEEVEPPQRGKLVEHEQQPMSPPLGVEIFRQSASDLIEDQADQRLGARDVGWRPYEVERSEENTSELQSLMRNSYAVL